MDAPWEWRRPSSRGWIHFNDPDDVCFHAYDVNASSACEPSLCLAASAEVPNEGSRLCPECIEVVKAIPYGRDRRLAS